MNFTKIEDNTILFSEGAIKHSNKLNLATHFHRQIELLYLIKGTLEITYGNNTYSIKENNIAIINSFEVHNFTPKDENNDYLLVILPDTLSIHLTTNNINSKVFYKVSEDTQKLLMLFSTFNSIDKKYLDIYFNIVARIINTLYNIDYTISPAKNIIEFIMRNYHQNLTLESVSVSCATNRSYVSKAVNEISGTNFNKYINKLRIAEFLDLYNNDKNNLSINDLALRTGFTSPRTFYRAFLTELGCTPSNYLIKSNKPIS
jgi:xylan 1,4-beta-xylosidase